MSTRKHLTLATFLTFILFFASPKAKAKNWKALFNGKNLDGWIVHSGTAKFKVADETIVGTTVPMSPNSFLCTQTEYSDFELELEVKCDMGLNSGVQIRSQIAKEGTQVTNIKKPYEKHEVRFRKLRLRELTQ